MARCVLAGSILQERKPQVTHQRVCRIAVDRICGHIVLERAHLPVNQAAIVRKILSMLLQQAGCHISENKVARNPKTPAARPPYPYCDTPSEPPTRLIMSYPSQSAF